jgi:preprotein translocase subunit YajC
MIQFFTNLPLLLGQPQTGGSGQGGGSSWVTMLVTFGLIIVIFYFLIIRPQRKKQKDAQSLLSNIRKGDRVSTIGGMRGTVQAVKENTVVLKVDDNTKIEFNKNAISAVLERKEEEVEEGKEKPQE